MIVTKLRLTFFFSFALLLAFTVVTDAKAFDQSAPLRRDHASINRLVKKRSPIPVPQGLAGLFGGGSSGSGAANAGADPPAGTPATSTAAASNTPAPSTDKPTDTASSAAPSSSAPASTAASPSSSSSASASDTNPLGIVSSLLSPASSTSASASTTSASSASSSSTSASDSKSSTTSPPTQATPPAVSQSVSKDGSSDVTVIVTSSPTSSASPSSTSTGTSSGTIAHPTEVVLIVIGAGIAGAAIIWTIIRKWKFRKSANFEDRMQPIDWQPTTDSGLPAHRRNSNASSFHSGHSETNYAGRGGGGGYGSDHGHGVAPLNPVPDHDFTAGTGGLAPVGGYADLARGPSPQPQMQEALSRGPSMARPQYDQYGVPLHHAGYGSQDPYARY